MKKKMICVECPEGCELSAEIEGAKVAGISGNKCAKGEAYASSEVENPERIFTSTVLAEGMDPRMVPVRTDRPIPKGRVMDASRRAREIRIKKCLEAGSVVAKNFLGLGVNLVATRRVGRQ